MNIDLHCHSYISDGKFSPQQVVQAAFENGAECLALTDHDHIGGLSAARQTAQSLGLSFINGVEISVLWRGRTIHIVGLNFTSSDELENTLKINRQGRLLRLQKIAEKLEKKNIVQNTIHKVKVLLKIPTCNYDYKIYIFLYQGIFYS